MSKKLTDKMNFGKYKEYTIKEVIEIAPQYIEWALDEIDWLELDDKAMEEYEKAIEEYYQDQDDLSFCNPYEWGDR